MENEELIIKQAQSGDTSAFEQIYKYYFQRIHRYCKTHMYREDLAADVCQETFLKAWKALPTFKFKTGWSLQAFLFRIARNILIDLSRKKAEFSLENYQEVEIPDNLAEELDSKEKTNILKAVLAKLPEIDRQIIMLRYFEELSHKEVASILNIREGALRVRTTRILKKLKEILPYE